MPTADSSHCALALDLGTTSVSAVAVDDAGRLLHAVTRAHRADVSGLPAGWAEQEPRIIRETAGRVLQELVAHCSATPVCLGMTGQMHGVLLLDAAQQPVSRLITWQDRRSLELHPITRQTHLQSLLERSDAEAIRRTGCRPSAGFLGTTLYTLRNTQTLPANADRAALIIDWLASNLTGADLCTDRSNAASTGLFDLERDAWSPPLLAAAHVPVEMLPAVRESGAVLGTVTAEAAAWTGLPAGLPVCNAIGDNQAAIVGSLPADEEVAHINIGTGGQFSRIVERFQVLPGLETRYLPQRRYMLVGAGLAGGDAIAWVQRTLAAWLRDCGIPQSDEELYRRLDTLMAGADPDAGGLECAPFFRGTRATPELRGSFRGVDNQNFTPGNVGRAVLNGMAAAFATQHELAAQAGPWRARRIIATGNAVRRNPLLLQRIADRLQLPVDLPVHREEAAYGAALLAGSQTGLWASLEAAERCIRHERMAVPAASAAQGPTAAD